MKKDAHLSRDILSVHLDGLLEGAELRDAEKHLAYCPDCAKALCEMKAVKELLAGVSEEDPGAAFARSVLDRLDTGKQGSPFLRPAWKLAFSFASAVVIFMGILLFRDQTNRPMELAKTEKPALGQAAPPLRQELKAIEPSREKVGRKDVAQPPAASSASGEGTASAPPSEMKQRPAFAGKSEAMGKEVWTADKKTDTDALARKEEFLASQSKEGGMDNRKVLADRVIPTEKTASPETEKSSRMLTAAKLKDEGRGETTMAIQENLRQKPPTYIVIRNAEEWGRIWNTQNVSQNLSLPLPKVDFASQMAIALPSRQDNQVLRILKADERKDRIVIHYRADPAEKKKGADIPAYRIQIVPNRPTVELQNTP